MPRKFAAALTHARHEHVFLDKWISHYEAIVGRENLTVVLDGDDWEPSSDLTGINVIVETDAPRRRIRNDRWAAAKMSGHANALRAKYHFVMRMDVDEMLAIDPEYGFSDWAEALKELHDKPDTGYVNVLGIDVVQQKHETIPIQTATEPFLANRRRGFVSDRYTKPAIIARRSFWSGGGHRLLNRPVNLSNHFLLFHLALADEGLAAQRMADRGNEAKHASFADHIQERMAAFAETDNLTPMPYEEAREIARAHLPYEPGTQDPARRPRPLTVPQAHNKGLFAELPERFSNLA